MIHISFTEQEIQQFRQERDHHPHPRVQKKMRVLLLKSEGLSHSQIARIEDLCENTVRSYIRDYQTQGIEALKTIRFHQPQSELTRHTATLEEYFRRNPPATIKEACAEIQELTGLQRGLTQVRTYLKATGLRRLKVGSLPSKANPDEQAEFREKK